MGIYGGRKSMLGVLPYYSPSYILRQDFSLAWDSQLDWTAGQGAPGISLSLPPSTRIKDTHCRSQYFLSMLGIQAQVEQQALYHISLSLQPLMCLENICTLFLTDSLSWDQNVKLRPFKEAWLICHHCSSSPGNSGVKGGEYLIVSPAGFGLFS